MQCRMTQKEFWGFCYSMRTSPVSYLFIKAICLWAEDFVTWCCQSFYGWLEKNSLAAAFIEDSSLDSIQLSSCALTSNIGAHCNTWLCCWEADVPAHIWLASGPFMKGRLLGTPLENVQGNPRTRSVCFLLDRRRGTMPRSFFFFLSGQQAKFQTKNKWHQTRSRATFNKNVIFSITGRKKEATSWHWGGWPQDEWSPAVCTHLAGNGVRLLGAGNGLQWLIIPKNRLNQISHSWCSQNISHCCEPSIIFWTVRPRSLSQKASKWLFYDFCFIKIHLGG